MDGQIERDLARNLLMTLLRLGVINKDLYEDTVITLILNMLKEGKI